MVITHRASIERMTRVAQAFPYPAAAALVGAAFLVRLLLDPWLGQSHPYGAFYPAIFGGAYLLGRSPAYFASVLAGLGGQWTFLHHSLGWRFDAKDLAPLLFFVVTVGVGIWLITRLTGALRRYKAAGADLAEPSAALQAQIEREMADGVSRAEFSRLVEGAIAEVDTDLSSARASAPSQTPPLTLHDWWEHLSVVVMPQRLLDHPGRRSLGFH